jgi:hypothetical protein
MKLIGGRLSAITALVAALSLPGAAQAGSISCTTKVAAVYLHGAGYVYADFGGTGGIGIPLRCNLNGSLATVYFGTVTADVCRGWLSMLMTTKSTQQNVYMVINDGLAPQITAPVNALPSWPSSGVTPLVPTIMSLTN